jgi:hypothetical protein
MYSANNTHLAIDVDGYFAPMAPGEVSFHPVTPCRVLDTRNPAGTAPFSGKRDAAVPGPCAPAGAFAYVLSATVIPSGPLGFLTLWPAGSDAASLDAQCGRWRGHFQYGPGPDDQLEHQRLG